MTTAGRTRPHRAQLLHVAVRHQGARRIVGGRQEHHRGLGDTAPKLRAGSASNVGLEPYLVGANCSNDGVYVDGEVIVASHVDNVNVGH